MSSPKVSWDLEAHYVVSILPQPSLTCLAYFASVLNPEIAFKRSLWALLINRSFQLLLTILETHCNKIDYQSIADTWPQGGARPTARAIKERISKIKKGEASGISSPATPKLPRRAPGKTKVTPSTPKKKRASEVTEEEEPVAKKPKGKGKGDDQETARDSSQDDAASEETEYDSV
ncbi:hypothetical protein N7520_008193 [Penicillium odoratum]|uniref:uncharacterized protein n=1 Tax=Penicillium odoratum TaxID=1167516 RepID=UPI0025479F0A|nr:uncharacterized protein N7520_008193 [Penicillium odoratum]KAJ5761037.1 hypothetical protein N7520_008193 [Penicillium odoratum]